MKYAAVIEQAVDGTWSGFIPDLACYVAGLSSPDLAREELRVSLAFAIEGHRLEGSSIPSPTTQVEVLETA